MFYIYANGKSIYQPMDDSLSLISPKLTVEMGKAGSLQFQIPPGNRYYSSLSPLSTVVTVELDDTEIFRGRVLTNNLSFNRVRTVYCEGSLAYLVDSVHKGEKYVGTVHDLFRRMIAAHNARMDAEKQFAVGEITVEDRSVILSGQSEDIEDAETGGFDYGQIAANAYADEWQTTYDAIESGIISHVGGYLRVRQGNGKNVIDLLADYGSTAAQEIAFGKNMLDMTEEFSPEDIFNVLIPLGDENLTIESVNNGSDELVDPSAVARYGGRIMKTHVFDGVTDPATLLENGRRYLATHVDAPSTITVKAVDMHLLDPNTSGIFLGDKVHVNSLPHGMTDTLTCTRIEYDLENAANNTYTFGTPKQSLTERYRKDRKQTQSDIAKSGRSGGGGAGSAAAEESQKQLDKLYDAYINVDPSAGHIDLGTLYKEFQNGKSVLEQTCGISIDAPTGNVDIRNLRTEFDDLGNTVRETNASISILNNETKTQIELLTSNHNKLKEQEERHYASFLLFSTDTESAIEGKADRFEMDAVKQDLIGTTQQVNNIGDVLTYQVGIHLDGTTGNVNIGSLAKTVDAHGGKIAENSAAIQTTANELTARIEAEARVNTANGEKIAKLVLRADATDQSIAEIQADLTKISGRLEVGDTTTVKGGLYATGSIGTAGSLIAGGGLQLTGGSFKIGNTAFSSKNITLVTSFTQASTPGYTANPVSCTLLAAAIGNGIARMPLAGSVTTIN